MNARLAVLAIVVALGIIYFYTANQKTELSSSSHSELTHKLELLEAENKKINQENINLEKKLTQPATSSSINHSSISISSTPSITALTTAHDETLSTLKKKSDNFQKWLVESSKKPEFNLDNEMQQRFNAEQIDFNWAHQQEGKFLDIFTDSKELSGAALKQATCKSTQCKISVSITNLENANEMLMAITKTLQNSMQNVMVIASPHIENGETVLYVSRDENSFEFN